MQKTCNEHGVLELKDIMVEKIKYKLKSGEVKESFQYRCRICRNRRNLFWKRLNKEKHIASSTKWKRENKERYNEWNRNDRKKNPEKHKEWYRKGHEKNRELISLRSSCYSVYMTPEIYYEMLKEQNDVCAICGNKETRKSGGKIKYICRLAIDHCHNRNIVRGLLCHSCNTGIGKFKDSIDLMKRAIAYLEKHKCEESTQQGT